ncbi:MAG: hypothetical protein WBE68_17405 [Candidatus Nitrosopolaris sp.]
MHKYPSNPIYLLFIILPLRQPHEIKITSPTKGQQVQVQAISGISADNTTSGCKVSVIVNGIKPYQNATPHHW